MSRLRHWWRSPWMSLVLVAIVSALLRYPALGSIPPGFHFDEGGEGVAATDVWNGVYRIWWPIGGGKEPLMAYAVQPFLRVFGFTVVALRTYSATMGVIAVLATWWLAKELFTSFVTESDSQPSPLVLTRPGPRATLAGLGLATAFWHVAYSRIAFRALAMPAVEGLALAWLWHALRRSESSGRLARSWPHFAGAGALIGLGAYTYLAGRFVPISLVLFFVAEAGLARLRGEQPLVFYHFKGLSLSVVAALLVFAPLFVFFVQRPAAFIERAGAVSIFNPAWNQGDLWGTLLRTTLTTLGTFTALTGDPNPIANLTGRPMLGPILAPFFWLGVLIAIWRVVHSISKSDQSTGRLSAAAASYTRSPAPYLFLLCWWPVMLLPGILAPEDAPHHLRIIGTAPATYILVAIGLEQISNLKYLIPVLREHPPRKGHGAGDTRVSNLGSSISNPLSQILASRFVAWLPFIIFIPIGLVTARGYFVRWARLPELYMAFDVYAVELAEQMAAETDPSAVTVIPMDLRAEHEARHYTLDFLYRGDTPYYYLPVDEATAADRLTQIAAGHETLRVVRWLQDKHAAADEREVVTFLLARSARLVDEETYPVYRIETWMLPTAHTTFALPTIETDVGATFGGVLRLEAADISGVAETVAVALRWAPLAAMDVDYTASLRLVAVDGSVATQKDRLLRHNWHQGTSLWPPETVNEYYLLPPASPGEYQVHVVVYDPGTLAPLMADGAAEISLGTVQIP